jgi:hypothetical protein
VSELSWPSGQSRLETRADHLRREFLRKTVGIEGDDVVRWESLTASEQARWLGEAEDAGE